eukprot:11158004-Lingulodinium_polyedra.AAC.1
MRAVPTSSTGLTSVRAVNLEANNTLGRKPKNTRGHQHTMSLRMRNVGRWQYTFSPTSGGPPPKNQLPAHNKRIIKQTGRRGQTTTFGRRNRAGDAWGGRTPKRPKTNANDSTQTELNNTARVAGGGAGRQSGARLVAHLQPGRSQHRANGAY